MSDLPRKTPAVFLDRDGTLMEDVDYCSDPKKVTLLPGVPEALRRLKGEGFRTIIITNQSGIGRGWITPEQYGLVHAALLEKIGPGLIDATYFCPHLPEAGCNCRKPLPEMVLQAAAEHSIDLAGSWFIGDKASDIGCGRNAGTRTLLVLTGYGKDQKKCEPDGRVEDLGAAAELILQNRGAAA